MYHRYLCPSINVAITTLPVNFDVDDKEEDAKQQEEKDDSLGNYLYTPSESICNA